MPTNQFPTFAASGGANTISADVLNAKTMLMANGFPNGQPPLSVDFNSLQRRSLFVAAALAKIMENAGIDALDNGDLNQFATGLLEAISNQAPSLSIAQINQVDSNISGKIKWASFNGHNGSIYGASGINSIGRTGTGRYVVYFSSPVPSSTYCVNITLRANVANYSGKVLNKYTDRFEIHTGGDYEIDFDMVDVSVLL